MKKVGYMQLGFTIILTILLAVFTMGNKGCNIGPIVTEPISGMIPKLIGAEVGETFTISLESNPSTGYLWEAEFDSEFLKLVDSKFVSEPTEDGPPMVGAPGIQTFEFLALKQGQTRVTMIYKRPLEDQYIDKKLYLVNIVPGTAQASTVSKEVGETFTISLKSNPTTGYMWQPEFDSEFLELVSMFVSDSTDPLIVGAGGTETFEFLPLKQGQARVRMVYKRAWEEEHIEEHITLVNIVATTAQALTVNQVAESMERLAGRVVVIEGEFRGWDVGDNVLGTLITRSDWGIKDDTGTIYVTGGTGGLDPAPSNADIGKSITLVALVRKQAESDTYFLRALEVHVR